MKRLSILTLTTSLGISAEEKPVTPQKVHGADESFCTGTAVEVQSIAFLDDKPMRHTIDHVTTLLQEKYSAAVTGKDSRLPAAHVVFRL